MVIDIPSKRDILRPGLLQDRENIPLEWNSDYEMGHPRLDAEHRALFEVLATLSRGYCDHDLVDTQIKILEHHVAAHFALEERMMVEASHAHLDQHRALHSKFRAMVARLRAHWQEDDAPSVRQEIIAELSDWLARHIVGTDHADLPMKSGPSSVG